MEIKKLGRYEITEVLGQGAMGIVYKGVDPMIGRTVALKTLKTTGEISEQQLAEFKRRFSLEAQSAGRLTHPNIVTIYDVGEEDGLAYIAMEFIKGRPLDDLISQKFAFPLDQIVTIMVQICEGLGYAHKNGVIHRDIKPANIVLTEDGVAKVTDFGIAKIASTSATQTGMVVGTPSYMSPEQITGRGVDNRSDIFSIGAVFYELLTYEKAFPGDNITTVMYRVVHENPTPITIANASLPSQFAPIIQKAMAKNPGDRYTDAESMANDIRNYKSPSTADTGATQMFNPSALAGGTVVMDTAQIAAAMTAAAPASQTGSQPIPAAATTALPAKKNLIPIYAGVGVVCALILYLVFGGKSDTAGAKSAAKGTANLALVMNVLDGIAMLDSTEYPFHNAKLEIANISAGERELSIRSEGYENYKSKLLFSDNDKKDFKVEMKIVPMKFPAGVDTAYITVDSKEMLRVTTNTGTMLGYAPFTRIPFPSGRHTLVFSKPFYNPQTSEIDAKKGKEIRMTPALKAKKASLLMTEVNPKKFQVFLNAVSPDAAVKPEKDGSTYLFPLGKSKVIIKLDGYKTYEQDLDLNDSTTSVKITATLEQVFGNLAVTSNPDGADVFMDGKNIGKTPLKLEKIAAGAHDFKIQKGAMLGMRRVSIEENKDNSADFKLEASIGYLKIIINPWGKISVDGRDMGPSPPLENLELKPGSYNIKIENPAFRAVTKKVTIVAGQSATLQYDFK